VPPRRSRVGAAPGASSVGHAWAPFPRPPERPALRGPPPPRPPPPDRPPSRAPPQLLDNPDVAKAFPSDVVERARLYLDGMGGTTGCYTHSQGALVLRKEIAKGIEARDGYPCDVNTLFMTDGATPCVHSALKLLIRTKYDAILTPIPQYPLYSACIELYGGTLTPYYLNEGSGWGLDCAHLKKQLQDARERGENVRALVVINPGNPTGQCLSYENQVEIVKFCREENLVLLADEVYQTNVYRSGCVFTSFKKVVRDLGDDYKTFTLFSMMSTSKGFYGECGRRGGYMEVIGTTKKLLAEIYKVLSIGLCSNTGGQINMALVMNPPREGEPSHPLYAQERDGLLGSLGRRAHKLAAALNEMDGVTCNDPEGAMYLFPRLEHPPAVWREAGKIDRSPEFLYCMELLEQEGIVCVPGKGFGQEPGTSHFRITFLPDEKDIDEVIMRLKRFNDSFRAKYAAMGDE